MTERPVHCTRRRASLRAALAAAALLATPASAATDPPAPDESALPIVSAIPHPLPSRGEIATMPFSERPTRFEDDRWMLYGWRLRFVSQLRGIFSRDLVDPSDRGESYLRGRVRADTELLTNLDAYFDGRLNLRWRRSRGQDEDVLVDGELSEVWLKWRQPLGLPGGFAQGGRVKLKEKRGFWWDEEFESFQIGLETSLLQGRFGVGGRLSQSSIDDGGRRQLRDDYTWIFFEGRHQWSFEQFVELRLLAQWDTGDGPTLGALAERDRANEDLVWIGGRLSGSTSPQRDSARVHYWFEIIGLTGRETRITTDVNRRAIGLANRSVSDWALDFGGTLETPLPGRLSLTAAFATASRRFQQPTPFRNRLTLSGGAPIRRFGEVLRPSLANMHVLSFAIGGELMPGVWLEALHHAYWQQDADRFLVDDALLQEPLGRDRDLGQALDLALGVAIARTWKVELKWGLLFAGDAFGSRSDEIAQRGTLMIRRSWP